MFLSGYSPILEKTRAIIFALYCTVVLIASTTV